MWQVLVHCFVGGNRSVGVALGYMLLDEAEGSSGDHEEDCGVLCLSKCAACALDPCTL